jgi:hypothetical protein
MVKAKKQKSWVVLNLKLPPAMKDALAQRAARDGQTASSVVRQLVADFLRAEGLTK